MKYKLFTNKADADRYIAHRDKLATAAGHKIPETPDMLKRGSRCPASVIPDEAMLAQHWTELRKHPKKNEWALLVPDDDLEHADKVDPETGHKYDLNNLYTKLPDDWAAEAEPVEMIP